MPTYAQRDDIQTGKFPVVFGDRRVWVGTITFDSSYPTGGEAIVPGDFGFSEINHVIVGPNDAAASRIAAWDRTNSKIKLFTALSTEAANASNQSTISMPLVVIGK